MEENTKEDKNENINEENNEKINDNNNNNGEKENIKYLDGKNKEENKNISKEENKIQQIENKINLNLIDNILDPENERKKEKERKKQEKQERKNKLLSKKHKSPEEIENEKIFSENNKILINFLGDSITEGLKWQKKEIFCFYLSKWLNKS